MKPRSDRRSIRLPGYDYSEVGWYFVTICTQNREHFFCKIINEVMVLSEFGQIAFDQWQKIPNRFANVELGQFVVMPNHVHGIIEIYDAQSVGAGFIPAQDDVNPTPLSIGQLQMENGQPQGLPLPERYRVVGGESLMQIPGVLSDSPVSTSVRADSGDWLLGGSGTHPYGKTARNRRPAVIIYFMNLLRCLNANRPLCVAIVGAGPLQIACVGAGGKTTALFSLARQVEGPAWVTTTTHLGTDQTHYADLHCVLESPVDFLPERYKQQKVTLLTGTYSDDVRIHSPAPEMLELIHLASLHEGIPLIIEADGSRSIPLKAPGEHEPVIPAWTTHVLVLVGMSALGKPLSAETVFRAEKFSELTGLPMGGLITLESICKMLVHPLGGLKNIPAGAQKVALFNQADSDEAKALVRSASSALLEGGYDRVIAGGLRSAPDGLECFSKI